MSTTIDAEAGSVSEVPVRVRSRGITYQELLATDSKPVPDCLLEESPGSFGDRDLPVSYYTDRAVHELEKERLWRRVWQFACREEHIPEVGDTHVYEIADISIVVVRASADEIKAYYNACLHRGRALRDDHGRVRELRCPFHSFSWNLDGSFKDMPTPWDFPQIDTSKLDLPEVKVGTWGGFVFINMDLDCEPLLDFLGVLPDHFDRWALQDRFVEVHVAKLIDCNWKIAQEAFSEALHVVGTHPQILAGIGDTNSQCDVWGNVSRVITPNGTPSPHLTWVPSEQDMIDTMLDRRLDEEPGLVVPEGMTAREISGIAARNALRPVVGDAIDSVSDAELTDSIDYTVFPNFHPWGGYSRIVYRFRPNGDDHRTCIMECLFLSPFQGERPPPAEVHWLGIDARWMEAEELGLLSRVFDQDSFNMPRVQAGLLSTKLPGVIPSLYQEVKLRQYYTLFEAFVAD